MAHYQVTIAYDGTEFNGFQRQQKVRTVQNEFEKALRKLGWEERSIISAGRTDTGVHARGQVTCFQLAWKRSDEDLQNALNGLLPKDIGIMDVQKAIEGFHARFDAILREYRYQVYFDQRSDPLKERYYWRVWPKPDFEILRQASCLFLGKHDLRRFGKPPNEKSTTIRTIESAEWHFRQDGSEADFTISAQAFLYHMVRRIVNVVVRSGQERISIANLKNSIEKQLELPAGIAPAKGLFLEEIIYK